MIPHPKLHFRNKVIVVTGAGGSIGSEICRQLITYEPAQLWLVARSEIDLFRIERELHGQAPAGVVRTALGSVTDLRFLDALFGGYTLPDIVIHAAAHKHVPICEEHPIEAVLNNVGGTIALAHSASKFGVGQFIMVSTDKAVKPASVMGATKRAC